MGKGLGAILCCLVFFASVAYGGQPYQNTEFWRTNSTPENLVVAQDGSGFCGPGSLYNVFNYFKDQGDYDGNITLSAINCATQYVDYSDFGAYVAGFAGGSNTVKTYGMSFDQLQESMDALYQNGDQTYNTYLCDGFTNYDDSEDEAERRCRLDFILDNFLLNDIPVVIHLYHWSQFNHYVTLVGYNPSTGTVYYVDSLHPERFISSVGYDDFIESKFYYVSWYYQLRWDGEWMVFWKDGQAAPDFPASSGNFCDN